MEKQVQLARATNIELFDFPIRVFVDNAFELNFQTLQGHLAHGIIAQGIDFFDEPVFLSGGNGIFFIT